MIEINIKKKLFSHDGEFNLSISKSINEGEFLAIFGKSGSGKTTILRIIAGLEKPDKGTIKFGNDIWFDHKKNINLPPQKRKTGFLFQDYALFPNMTVEDNIKFAMEKKDDSLLKKLIEITELEELRNRNVQSLSGGQKQRVALARAVARKPRILLLDEPLSALDFQTRLKLQDEILKIHKEFNLTTILVSHDYSEIFKMTNRVLVIENGEITKDGSPEDIFLQEKLSGKFKITGEILKIEKEDVLFILTIQAGGNILKVVATENEIRNIKTGDKVLIASKAFNPIIMKI